MIKVGTDKRTIRSAMRLADGLIQCMQKKDFTEINVTDLQRASGISRATFYRLFDNVQDVLDYKCQAIAREIPDKFQAASPESRGNFLVFTLRCWMSQKKVLDAVFKSGRADILQNALLNNSGFFSEQLSFEEIPPKTMDYLAPASMGILSSILMTWVRRGKKETPDQLAEMFRNMKDFISIIDICQ